MTPRYAALVGLGFGDCGKGLYTDALCRRWPVHTVVRYNGGAQAGHNVVLPDGRHHTYSQFGAGSFVDGVHTLLSAPVVVHPTALRVEEAALRRAGVSETWSRLLIDERCRITTPFHQAAGRLRELRRGSRPHGTCGAGVGETVRHALAHPDETLHYADLLDPARALDRLHAIRIRLAAEFDTASADGDPRAEPEARALADETLAARWLAAAREVAALAPPMPREGVAQRLRRDGTLLFEGAQGMLLDESHGLHPHTTWSDVTPSAADAVLRDAGLDARVARYGVLRTYLTRHGAGPLPTHDPALDAALPEPHNTSDGWQGAFRRGHPDAVLLRHAATAAGPLDGLLLSHLDALARPGVALRWCEGYEIDGNSMSRTDRLPAGAPGDLTHQAALTALLQRAQPRYAASPMRDERMLLDRIEEACGAHVRCVSRGPTHRNVSELS